MAAWAVTLLCVSCAISTTSRVPQDQSEDPWKKFQRKGGRIEKTQIVQLQDYELSSQDIAQKRNLKLYDQGGYFNCFTHIPVGTQKKQDEIERKASQRVAIARQFILSHWEKHRRGYIRLSFDSVDAYGTSHIFIEPDSNGKWQVIWRGVNISKQLYTLPVIRTVVQDFTENERGELVFKDSDGDEWRRL
ncbi:MAG: hypothetical protein JSS69_08710 [Acidobacteria bacterium]|nr:hypothetical protein [Acidobacteriota bacterium]MBS1865986.1 hypothetical protein [Acidobacteriota bacterium]